MKKSKVLYVGQTQDERGNSLISDSINQKKKDVEEYLLSILKEDEFIIFNYILIVNEIETKETNLETKRHHFIAAKIYDFFVFDKSL